MFSRRTFFSLGVPASAGRCAKLPSAATSTLLKDIGVSREEALREADKAFWRL
jgi:hypothetical protein